VAHRPPKAISNKEILFEMQKVAKWQHQMWLKAMGKLGELYKDVQARS
jgi:hypothetical protein